MFFKELLKHIYSKIGGTIMYLDITLNEFSWQEILT